MADIGNKFLNIIFFVIFYKLIVLGFSINEKVITNTSELMFGPQLYNSCSTKRLVGRKGKTK